MDRRSFITNAAVLAAFTAFPAHGAINSIRPPGWIIPGAFADFDFRNKRAFGAPVTWTGNGTMPSGASAVMQASGFNDIYLPGADGIFRVCKANSLKIAEGVGVANFGNGYFQALWNRDLTNAVWVKTGLATPVRSIGADGVTNSGSRLTATSANATCTQSITLTSQAMLLSVVARVVSGVGVINISVDGGTTFKTLNLISAFQQFANLQQTLTNPTVWIQIVNSGDVIDIDFVDLETGVSGGAICPVAPGPPIVVSGTGNLQRWSEIPEINNGRGGGGYPNGALGDRWLNVLNSGQAAVYVEFMGNPRSLAGYAIQTDGVAPSIIGLNPGSPALIAGVATSNVMLPGWNKAMSGYDAAATGGGGGARLRGCLNGGPLISVSSSVAALNATHMVLGGQGSEVQTLDGYIGRLTLFDHLPPDRLFVEATTFY